MRESTTHRINSDFCVAIIHPQILASNLYNQIGRHPPLQPIIHANASIHSKMTRPTKSRPRRRISSRESLRRSFRPPRVRILFIGESPPASGRFFYQADSGLYRAIRDAFLQAFPGAPFPGAPISALARLPAANLPEANFLQSFQSLGCYLVELCPQPVDRLSRTARSKAHRQSEPALAATLRQLRPAVVITLLRSIGPSVLRAQKAAHWSGPHQILPYPGRWQQHRTAFLQALIPLLRHHLTPTPATIRPRHQ